jgi:hypothetical protein
MQVQQERKRRKKGYQNSLKRKNDGKPNFTCDGEPFLLFLLNFSYLYIKFFLKNNQHCL